MKSFQDIWARFRGTNNHGGSGGGQLQRRGHLQKSGLLRTQHSQYSDRRRFECWAKIGSLGRNIVWAGIFWGLGRFQKVQEVSWSLCKVPERSKSGSRQFWKVLEGSGMFKLQFSWRFQKEPGGTRKCSISFWKFLKARKGVQGSGRFGKVLTGSRWFQMVPEDFGRFRCKAMTKLVTRARLVVENCYCPTQSFRCVNSF